MKKITLMLLFVSGSCIGLLAQNIDQGKRFLYYHRYQSAKDQFQKLLASNPNNIDAVYWLGQTLIGDKDSIAAKELYQKALASNGNAPLLLVGMGHIELMENKMNDARQRFETAISLTKGADINVMNAIAHANVHAPLGDANYAIEKLKSIQPQRKKDIKNAETYLIMGEAHRKLIDGGSAVTAFQQALTMDPKLEQPQNMVRVKFIFHKTILSIFCLHSRKRYNLTRITRLGYLNSISTGSIGILIKLRTTSINIWQLQMPNLPMSTKKRVLFLLPVIFRERSMLLKPRLRNWVIRLIPGIINWLPTVMMN